MIGITFRCPEPTCREAVERAFTGKPVASDEPWQHMTDGSPACGEGVRFEVAPHKVGWSGRIWRIEEARQAMRRDAMTRAGKLVEEMHPPAHCGECKAGLRLSIAGAIEKTWEDAHSWSQDEYLRDHPVRPLVAAH